MRRDRLRVTVYSVLIGLVLLAVWQAATTGRPKGRSIPGPAAVAATAAEMLAHPFYDNGPNDKGIGLQLAASLGRMAIGYTIASVLAVSLGVALGLSAVSERNSLRDSCAPHCSTDQIEGVRQRALAANISFGVGAVAAATAVATYLFRPEAAKAGAGAAVSASAPPLKRLSVWGAPAPAGGYVALQADF